MIGELWPLPCAPPLIWELWPLPYEPPLTQEERDEVDKKVIRKLTIKVILESKRKHGLVVNKHCIGWTSKPWAVCFCAATSGEDVVILLQHTNINNLWHYLLIELGRFPMHIYWNCQETFTVKFVVYLMPEICIPKNLNCARNQMYSKSDITVIQIILLQIVVWIKSAQWMTYMLRSVSMCIMKCVIPNWEMY